MNMHRFNFLESSDIRQINGATRRLVRCRSRDELGNLLIKEIDRCFPGDMNTWSETTPDFSEVIDFAISDGCLSEMLKRVDAITAYMPEHPIVSNIGWGGIVDAPKRVSDVQSNRAFRENPIYREAYRHLDCNFQLSFNLGMVGQRRFIVALNRKSRDYSDRERDKLHLLGIRASELIRLSHELERVHSQIRAIEGAFDFNPGSSADLTPSELRLLQRTLSLASNSGKEARLSESERKTRQEVIEKLQLESASQLFALLHRFRA